MMAVFRQGAEIPVLFDEIVIIGKFIVEKAVTIWYQASKQ